MLQKQMLADGVSFLSIRDNRFKTLKLSVGIFLPLREETVTANAILADLLTRATAKSPNMIAMNRRLSRLYGASLSSSVQKLGDHQVLSFSISCIQNRFCLHGEDVAAECATLMLEMLFKPHLSADGLFDAGDVEQEKRCLAERIAAAVNDKRTYARMREEALCAGGEPYGLFPFGTVPAAQALTREEITDAWKQLLETAVFQWVYVSDDSGEQVANNVRAAFAQQARAPHAGETITTFDPSSAPRRAIERMQVNQAKLSMGFRLQAHEPDTNAVMTARLLSALFGGSPTSLLFRNVREKMSLCYYCSSAFERTKGVLTVDSGVDVQNLEIAEQEILHQLDNIRNNAFSDEELEQARRYLTYRMQEYENLQGNLVGWYLGQTLLDTVMDPETAVQKIRAVSREDIVALAKTVTLVSVFTVMPEVSV